MAFMNSVSIRTRLIGSQSDKPRLQKEYNFFNCTKTAQFFCCYSDSICVFFGQTYICNCWNGIQSFTLLTELRMAKCDFCIEMQKLYWNVQMQNNLSSGKDYVLCDLEWVIQMLIECNEEFWERGFNILRFFAEVDRWMAIEKMLS